MKVLQILQFVGLIAERIMFWKKNNNTTNNERREQIEQKKSHITTARVENVGFCYL